MNREQRRDSMKHDQRIVVKTIQVTFENGQVVNLDPTKIQIVDRDTKANLFQVAMQPVESKPVVSEEQPEATADNYVVTFDTPEGKMQYVKNGNWSGVKKA